MSHRILTTVIGLPLVITIIWIDSPFMFSGFVSLVAAVASLEICNMARRWGDRPISGIVIIGAAMLVATSHYVSEWPFSLLPAEVLVSVGVLLSLIWLLTRGQTEIRSSRWISTGCTLFFIGGFLFHAPLMRDLDQGREWMLFVILVTFAMDSAAFISGKAIGRSPLAVTISPSKTREGAIGGLIGAFVTTILLVQFLDLNVTLWKMMLLGSTTGIAGQIGDLVESRLKRIALVKDSGIIIPGHGGVLDRIDSIVFNLVVVYHLVS